MLLCIPKMDFSFNGSAGKLKKNRRNNIVWAKFDETNKNPSFFCFIDAVAVLYKNVESKISTQSI
jgi:hypothetical protein